MFFKIKAEKLNTFSIIVRSKPRGFYYIIFMRLMGILSPLEAQDFVVAYNVIAYIFHQESVRHYCESQAYYNKLVREKKLNNPCVECFQNFWNLS